MFAGSNLKDLRGQVSVAAIVREHLRRKEIGSVFSSASLGEELEIHAHNGVASELSKLARKRGALDRKLVLTRGAPPSYEYTLLTHDFKVIRDLKPGPGSYPGHWDNSVVVNRLSTTEKKSSLSDISDKLLSIATELSDMGKLPMSEILDSVDLDELFAAIRRRMK